LALELKVIWAGRRSPGASGAARGTAEAWETLAADFRQRIAAFHPIEERAVRVAGAARAPSRLRDEGRALAAAAPADALWIALERTGKAFDSEGVAREVERWRREWSRPVVFFVGSDLGLDAELVRRCRLSLSLGPLTLPHALARLVLLEQLYRAFSLGAGWPYHR
jgi:23S rRNA (pseudouridine1915-N3)-methyltransferase